MRKQHFILMALSLLLPIACEAADMTYQGKPIDSLCLFDSGKKSNIVSLKNCGVSAKAERKRSGASPELLANNYIGYDYSLTANPNTEATHGYSYYKVVGKVADSFITYSLNSDGGNGEFSSLNLVKPNHQTLSIRTIAGGNQCNKGIYDVKTIDKKLVYSVNLTSADFLKLANNRSLSANAYKELESCPTCCAASAVFERNLKNTLGNEKLVSVNLNAYQQEMSPETQKKYQACFDNLVMSYQKDGKSSLNTAELNTFSNDFNEKCAKA